MNILISALYAAPCSGNFIGSMMDLGLFLRERGDTLYFVFPECGNTTSEKSWTRWLEKAGFTVYLADMSKSQKDQLEFLKRILAENQIDILHIHFDLFYDLAMKFRKELDVKIIVHEHMEYPAGRNRFIQALKYIRRSLIFRSKRISIISVNKYVDRAHFCAKHWYVPNGLSLKRNVSRELTREECRKKLGIREEEKLVLFLGWDLYRKGLDIAIKAVEECRKTDPDIILGVVGIGTRDNLAQKGIDYIQERTEISPYADWIHYLPSTEDMFAYHRAADVYLSSSRSEAFSYGILEAISQKVPVVASDIKGTGWCGKYSETEFYSVENPDACSRALLAAVKRTGNSSNYQEVCDEFSITHWCESLLRIYKKA